MTKEEFIISQYAHHLSAFYAKNQTDDIIALGDYSRQAAIDIAIGDADFIEHNHPELFEHVQFPITFAAGNRIFNDAPSKKGELDPQEKSFKDSITEIARNIGVIGMMVTPIKYNPENRRAIINIVYSIEVCADWIADKEQCFTDREYAARIAAEALDILLQRHHAKDPIRNIPAFSEAIINRIVELLVQKNHDYGNSFGNQLAKHGPIVFKIRMEDKISRLKTLLTPVSSSEAAPQSQVKDESIEDTLRDIIGYCILFLHHTK